MKGGRGRAEEGGGGGEEKKEDGADETLFRYGCTLRVITAISVVVCVK